jgi:hypothetical protein
MNLSVISSAALVLAVVFSAAASAQMSPPVPMKAGEIFPRLEGEFLSGRKAVLPDAAQGKLALVLMGFTYGSRFPVEAWAEHVRKVFATRDAATFFEVPVLGGMARMGKWFIDSGMRRGTPKELHENVITVWGGVDRWKALAAFSPGAENDAYLILIGRDGRILWLHHGPYSEQAFAEMLNAGASQ